MSEISTDKERAVCISTKVIHFKMENTGTVLTFLLQAEVWIQTDCLEQLTFLSHSWKAQTIAPLVW